MTDTSAIDTNSILKTIENLISSTENALNQTESGKISSTNFLTTYNELEECKKKVENLSLELESCKKELFQGGLTQQQQKELKSENESLKSENESLKSGKRKSKIRKQKIKS